MELTSHTVQRSRNLTEVNPIAPEKSAELSPPGTRRAGPYRRRRLAPRHLGSYLLNQIYDTIPGKGRKPTTLAKRAGANGLTEEPLEYITESKTWEEVPKSLRALAESHLQQAVYWHDIGIKVRARDHYFESCLLNIYGAMITPRADGRALLLHRAQTSYGMAAAHFVHPAEPVSIPYLSTTLSGYLRLPETQNADEDSPQDTVAIAHPVVMLFNGMNAPKEELHLTENAFLATGTATLSFDYPEPCLKLDSALADSFSFDTQELGNALLLFLASRNDIDIARVGAFGTSFGARIALCVAAQLPGRLKAIASLSAPLDPLNDPDLLLSTMHKELAAPRSFTKAALRDLAAKTPLRGMLAQLTTPLLAVGGSKDLIATAEETRTIFDECSATDKKLVICSSAGHNCYEMMPSLRHEIAQWLRQRL